MLWWRKSNIQSMYLNQFITSRTKIKIRQEITPVSDIDPMMDEFKVLVRCISIWYNHPPGKPEMKWGLEMGNRIQVSVKKDGLSKFQPILQEGSCYKISNFGVGENRGRFPLLSHKYRINFYKNTSVTRVNKFDNNVHGFKFEPFQNFATKHFSPTDVVDVIGTVVSISDLIPFSGGLDQEKRRRTILLEDVDGLQMECCFFDGWAYRFNTLAEQRETVGHVVLILQLAKVKYFNGKPSIGNAIVSTKIYNNAEIPEIVAFKRRYQEIPGLIFKLLYVCGRSAKEANNKGTSRQASMFKKKVKTYACKIHKGMTSVVPKCKVIIRMIDDTDSASLLLYEDMIMQLINVPCYKMLERYKDSAADIFPDELKFMVGKKFLFHYVYSNWNITNNNHVYQVKQMTEDPAMIEMFKKDFYVEENDVEFQTLVTNALSNSKFRYQDMIPFNIEQTPESVKGVQLVVGASSSKE
ncbi:replication protein A 70 kDa DNA-binding subunit B [Tanacetum coccineum]